jgi:hypothetical protein
LGLRAVAAVVGTNRGGALVPRAILVQRHARQRRKGWRFINPAAGIALTRHASTLSGVGTLTVAAPRAIGMIFTDPAGVVAN